MLPVMEQMKAPATRDEIVAIVMREMPAWGVGAKHAAEYGVTYASYADALEGHSVYAVEEAVVRWNSGQRIDDLKMGGFPPRPAQLGLLAQEAKTELYMAAYRCGLALKHIEKKPEVWTPERKRAEREKAIAMGLLTPDGKVNFEIKPRSMDAPRPTRPPSAVAQELRAMADDLGDVV